MNWILLLGMALFLTGCTPQASVSQAHAQENKEKMEWHEVTKLGFIFDDDEDIPENRYF